MSNHLHIAMVAGEAPLEGWAKRVNSPFANWLNDRHGRLGPVFADRPTVFVIRPQHEARLIAYIHNNPVRAGVVARAVDSSWTSHACYVGAAPAPTWLNVDDGLARCGVDRRAFDGWVAAETTTAEPPDVAAISRVARARGAVHVATPTASPTDAPLVARPFAHIRPDPRAVVQAVAQLTGLPATELASRATTARSWQRA
jgi:hypothetical protein